MSFKFFGLGGRGGSPEMGSSQAANPVRDITAAQTPDITKETNWDYIKRVLEMTVAQMIKENERLNITVQNPYIEGSPENIVSEHMHEIQQAFSFLKNNEKLCDQARNEEIDPIVEITYPKDKQGPSHTINFRLFFEKRKTRETIGNQTTWSEQSNFASIERVNDYLAIPSNLILKTIKELGPDMMPVGRINPESDKQN